jgi:hypothetical protein
MTKKTLKKKKKALQPKALTGIVGVIPIITEEKPLISVPSNYDLTKQEYISKNKISINKTLVSSSSGTWTIFGFESFQTELQFITQIKLQIVTSVSGGDTVLYIGIGNYYYALAVKMGEKPSVELNFNPDFEFIAGNANIPGFSGDMPAGKILFASTDNNNHIQMSCLLSGYRYQ